MKILGGIDVIAGLVLILNFTGILSKQILLVFGFVFLIKSSLGFWKDFASWVDVVAGIVFLFAGWTGIPYWIGLIAGLFVLQKGAFSFIGSD
jgi:hypothetical protein